MYIRGEWRGWIPSVSVAVLLLLSVHVESVLQGAIIRWKELALHSMTDDLGV